MITCFSALTRDAASVPCPNLLIGHMYEAGKYVNSQGGIATNCRFSIRMYDWCSALIIFRPQLHSDSEDSKLCAERFWVALAALLLFWILSGLSILRTLDRSL